MWMRTVRELRLLQVVNFFMGSMIWLTDMQIENARVITVGTGSDEKQYMHGDSIEGAVTGSCNA